MPPAALNAGACMRLWDVSAAATGMGAANLQA
jgi:hypothetical protein